MSGSPVISTVIADDHEIIRDAITTLLDRMQDDGYVFDIVGYASNGIEALALVKARKPELLFLDISMPFASGSEILHDLRRWSPDTRVVVFTGLTGPALLAGLVEQGVHGLFSKGSSVDLLRDKLPTILEGVPVIASDLAEIIGQSQSAALTSREQQVLNMIVAGKSNKEIAAELFLSPKTVDKHRTSLMSKLEVHSVAQLMARAIRDGLVVSE
ncbi:MAG: response regulator transcription factor [Halieaceae bacterium]|jgi:DNA-binding NarL/FixJ family response regulator|nr:response regulator transcription factor [Halieaceae bacterium]